MSLPALESMAEEVKAAREAKGLSQRGLSQRTGIPQSHISKIENAGADIRISSMLMIAHALDLELALIPRQLVPLLKNIQNQTKESSRLISGKTLETLQELEALEATTARILNNFAPEDFAEAEVISILRDTLRGLARLHMSASQAEGVQDRIKHLKKPLNALKTLLATKSETKGAANYQTTFSSLLGTINPIARDLRDLRNRFYHEIEPDETAQQPAYQLDAEEEGDG